MDKSEVCQKCQPSLLILCYNWFEFGVTNENILRKPMKRGQIICTVGRP